MMYFFITGYDGRDRVPQNYFPGASVESLMIEGSHSISYVGFKTAIRPCKNFQPMEKKSYKIFHGIFQRTFNIVKASTSTFRSIKVHEFDMDLSTLYAVNNASVYHEGLLDGTRMKNGIPYLLSTPHFLYGDKNLAKTFNMSPKKETHKSTVSLYNNLKGNESRRVSLN